MARRNEARVFDDSSGAINLPEWGYALKQDNVIRLTSSDVSLAVVMR